MRVHTHTPARVHTHTPARVLRNTTIMVFPEMVKDLQWKTR
jgi:hypothetical protein